MLNEKKPKLRISPKKYNGDTSVISTRIPKEMLKDIDAVAGTTGRTRNEIMLMCLEYALNNMEIIND
jgi:predicted DNA-binding protein